MCPTSNFRSVSRNFCVVKSRRRKSLTENANREDRCETSRAKSVTRLGINHAGVSCALSGISEIDCRLIDSGRAGRKPQVCSRGKAAGACELQPRGRKKRGRGERHQAARNDHLHIDCKTREEATEIKQ